MKILDYFTKRMRKISQPKSNVMNQYMAPSIEKTEELKIYVGNTVKVNLPKIQDNIIKKITYYSEQNSIASVDSGIVTGRSAGEVMIIAQVILEGPNQKEQYIQYETLVKVIVGKLKLKTYYSTKYHMNGAMILKERESTFLSLYKTAKIIPALSYGVFTSISYVSSDETIATVTNCGLIGLVTGKSIGKVAITATALIADTVLMKSIIVDVKERYLPISNPTCAYDYTKENDWEGNRVYFGRYEQDNNYANGKEPILWRVLEVTEDSVLLLSEYGLESKNINDYFVNVTWENCTLRTWLNETFLNTAFTNQEISVILDSNIHTPDNEEWGTSGGNDTVDKVFLLSVKEATNPNYGFYSNFLERSVSRTVKNTKYARFNDGYVNKTNGNTCWWLRSPGCDRQFAYFFTNGSGTYSYFVGRRNDAVRPAIRLKLSDISFAIDERAGGYPYIVVN